MKKKLKIFVAAICLLFVLAFSGGINSYANSAQTNWSGVDQAGLVIKEGDSPIVVESEVLTLDLLEFPKNYYDGAEDFLSYTGKVSAEYTFYNPSDYTVTATLLFPFGKLPDYANDYDEQSQSSIPYVDTKKYDITLDGKAVTKNIRYSLDVSAWFDLSKALERLSDRYIVDDFYKPNTTVTKYVYVVGGENKEGVIDENKYRAATIAFDYDGGDGNTKIYFPSSSGFKTLNKGGARFSKWAQNGDEVIVYAIGTPLNEPFEFKCYENGAVEDKKVIDGIVSLTKTQTLSFEEFALENWTEDLGVSKIDWYNAVVCTFTDSSKVNPKYNFVDSDFSESALRFRSGLMRWYEYQIVMPPKTKLKNVVTAPIYPDINLNYNPSVFSYTYLLSPAKTWKSFGSLDIIINTPYYISNSSIDGFSKTQNGYEISLPTLPNTELAFNLSTSENPVLRNNYKRGCGIF